MFQMIGNEEINLPAECDGQDAVMLTWPNSGTDWEGILWEAEQTYIQIVTVIAAHQKVLIVCDDADRVGSLFSEEQKKSIRFYELPYNDTWARDHGPIITFSNDIPIINDFGFNGWGNKFEAGLDNLVTSGLFASAAFDGKAVYNNCLELILEGGSIESDGMGTLLTTSACLLNPNRNPGYTRAEIENKLFSILGARQILWLNHGHIEGDDTDSHIDTLARFCDENTIAYVKCTDPADSHFMDFQRMEEELRLFRNLRGEPYKLVALPMASPIYDEDGKRMGATYANFLIINGMVLVPVYGVPEDPQALEAIGGLFPGREIRGINCVPLIRQNGSLHCITMQIPKGTLS
jgi:agmatine deiminase